MSSSDEAVLSSIRAQIDDLVVRVIGVAKTYDNTPDSSVLADLYAAERSLIAAGRCVARAAVTVALIDP